ncbi:MAG: hypothetical protein GY696_34780 [Gammaproteobacteria bacterium]|nr:hypothetical protein [Gammaproteobacteria bacterium]
MAAGGGGTFPILTLQDLCANVTGEDLEHFNCADILKEATLGLFPTMDEMATSEQAGKRNSSTPETAQAKGDSPVKKKLRKLQPKKREVKPPDPALPVVLVSKYMQFLWNRQLSCSFCRWRPLQLLRILLRLRLLALHPR